ncbi:hypothetical protein HWV62_4167 [Athelia sp. TMB]|nr:hypothetical protein HWV62_4167 [Athelia sp. TMB]
MQASRLTRRSALVRSYSSSEPKQTNPENQVEDGLEQPSRRGYQLPPHYHIAHPNLAEFDPQLDASKVKVFPPSPKNPFVNRVTFRNTEPAPLPPNEEPRPSASAQKAADGEDEMQQINSADVDLKQHLPLTPGEINNLYQFPLFGRRITKQTGKGKIHRMHQLIVVGNGDGLVGYGEGKDLMDPQRAKEKALIQAVRSMDRVERFEKRTIFGEMSTKMGSTKIILRPRPVGFGLQCNPKIHQVLKAAGIKDVSAKVWGSRNPINVIKALFRILHSGNQPAYMGDGIGGKGRRTFKGEPIQSREAVERARGRRMADLRT